MIYKFITFIAMVGCAFMYNYWMEGLFYVSLSEMIFLGIFNELVDIRRTLQASYVTTTGFAVFVVNAIKLATDALANEAKKPTN